MAKKPARVRLQNSSRSRPGRVWPTVHVGLAAIVAVAALLAVLPPQSYRLFQARLVASEGSVWVLLAASLVLLTARPGRRGFVVAALAVLSIAAAAVPLVRAQPVASSLPGRMASAFGRVPEPDMAAIGRRAPLVFRDLFGGVGLPDLVPRTIVYATVDGRELLMDVFTPAQPRRAVSPGVLVVHGGGWRGGARTEFSGLSRHLAGLGYVIASVDYRLAPASPFPAARDDVTAAVAALRIHAPELGLDAGRLALIGRSAGGQLVLLAAYTMNDPAVKGVVSFYGPTDLVYGYEHPADPDVFDSTAALAAYLGGHLRDRGVTYRMASPIAYVAQTTTPTLLIHGTPDELVEVEQSRRLDRRLREAGAPHLLVELPWASHGCDYFLRGPCGQISTYAVEGFLARVLRAGDRD
jgi:acetyl esterase/lipase